MRSVSVLQVAEPRLWDELCAMVDLAPLLGPELSPTQRVVAPGVDELLPSLKNRGLPVLERMATRDVAQVQASQADLRAQVDALPPHVRKVLHSAQQHALDGLVLGMHAWDPSEDAGAVRHLHGAGLIRQQTPGAEPYAGLYSLHEDLPPPPEVAYDFDEAVMEVTDDLSQPENSTVSLLHDLAALAAALHQVSPRRTHAGTLNKGDARKLGRSLGATELTRDGNLEGHPRWKQALDALQALGAVSMEPLSRELFLDLGLERTLAGSTAEAVDRFVHRLVERDLHVVLPAIRAALKQAGRDGALDEVIFLDELRLQHRDVFFPPWQRQGLKVYPHLPGEQPRPYDENGWDKMETRMVEAVLRRVARLGLIRRAPGVFAATEDGMIWAQVDDVKAPPVWVTSDLEIIVPPRSVTPWDRFQLERLGRCITRDVVDHYQIQQEALVKWLQTHEVDEAIGILRKRAAGVPLTVVETLTEWARSATRVILVRGVLLTD